MCIVRPLKMHTANVLFNEIIYAALRRRKGYAVNIKSCFKNLSVFERTLWIVSLIVVSGSFLLAPGRDCLTLAASLIGVTALIFIAKGYVLGQVLTAVFALFYGAISLSFKYYGEVITYLGMSFPIAVFSIITWLKHPYKKSAEVKVDRMSLQKWLFMCLAALTVTCAFYFILKALGNPNLLFSTLSVTTSFTAAYLSMMRSPFYAVAYAANDIVLIVLWILASVENAAYLPMVFCFLMFLANDVYGFINWRKIRARQEA